MALSLAKILQQTQDPSRFYGAAQMSTYDPAMANGHFDANGDWVMGVTPEQYAAQQSATKGPPPGSMTGQQVFSELNPQRDSSGSLWARNPKTGQPERLIRGIHGVSTYGDTGTDPYEGSHYYFENDQNASADAVARGAQLGMSDADKKHFNTGSGLVQGGLATMGAFAGAGALGYGPAAAGSSAAAGATGAAEGATAAAAGGAEAAAAGGALMPAAVPETAGALSSMGMVETAPGVFTAMNAPAAAAPGLWETARSIPGVRDVLGDGLLSDIAKGIPGLVGAFAADRQADRYGDLAQQYMGFGAPSRARFEGSFQPGFSMTSDPGYTDALNQSAKGTLHGLSAKFGNPADSPNAWATTLSDLYKNTAYPALQNFRNTNAAAGGLASFAPAAVGASGAEINAENNIWGALGGAAGDIFSPPKSEGQLLSELYRAWRSGNT